VAELLVRVQGGLGELTMTCQYEFRADGLEGPGPIEQEFVVGPSPALVRRLCGELDRVVETAVGGCPNAADPTAELVRLGGMLRDALFPSSDGTIPELVRRLRDARGPLLVRTNESSIPWELLHDGNDFLALGHELGRRTFVNQRVVGGRALGPVRRALVVGDPLGDLDAARREAGEVTAWLASRGVGCTTLVGSEATLLRVVGELSTENYDLLHYCGHVAAPHGTDYVGLRLHGDELFDRRALEPLAGVGAPPVVVINGCASADRLENLCVAFMVLGAKVVVGTRHTVGEEPAREFAHRFYTELVAGASAGAAVHAGRRALRGSGAMEWASFVLYGDPAARIVMGEPSGDTESRRPSGVDAYRMDAEAREIVDRAVGAAGPSGFVTSLELLLELLATDVMRNRITEAVGAERFAFATQVLRTFRETVPSGGVAADAPVELSDTVTTVLVRAERAAQEDGRGAITTADLVAAFMAVGGGSSSQILGLLGIPLSDMVGPGSPPDPTTSPTSPEAAQTITGARPALSQPADELFDDSGDLRVDRLDPDVERAVRAAALLASLHGTTISSVLLLYGFAVAGGPTLRAALDQHGQTGADAVESLTPKRRTRRNRFSSRARDALLRAIIDNGAADEATVLRELIAAPGSSAAELLRLSGVDVNRLLRDL